MTDSSKPTTAPEPKSKAIKHDDGSPVLAFPHYDEAAAQAKALGKGWEVEPVGVAFAVRKGD
jgi:hypothetical protein